VTIAVSTIISAINALTMTPSRAVMIFKTEEGHHGHELKREALPWWIFAVVGGVLSIWYGQDWAASRLGSLLGTGEAGADTVSSWMYWVNMAANFAPGAAGGAVLGLIVIRPVNAMLGWLFRGFNRLFDRMTELYGWLVGHVLRISVLVLVAYGGLLGLTYFEFNRAPTGFVPQQDKGYLLLNVQLPDSASVERTQRVMARIEALARESPGVQHTVGVSGQSLLLNANAPNLGSMYIMLKEFSERRGPGLTADAIAEELQTRCKAVRGAIVSIFGAPPIDGLGTTGGFKLIIEDRGNLGLD
jgi:multidrug efflux pump